MKTIKEIAKETAVKAVLGDGSIDILALERTLSEVYNDGYKVGFNDGLQRGREDIASAIMKKLHKMLETTTISD